MDLQTKPFTVEDFDKFIELPENTDKVFEFIGGEIIEVTTNTIPSQIAINIAFFLKLHLYQNKVYDAMMGSDGGYIVAGERYCPDVSYSSKKLEVTTYNPFPPDLAVEVISPSDSMRAVNTKITNYLAAGTVVVHTPGQIAKTFTEHDTLEGGNVLPGLSLAVKEIFVLPE